MELNVELKHAGSDPGKTLSAPRAMYRMYSLLGQGR